MKTESQHWIDALHLTRHPEGGYFKETFRSHDTIKANNLRARFGGNRRYYKAIYFLLVGEDFSAFHRLKQDEVWHFYTGSSLTIHIIDPSGGYSTIRLGISLQLGELPQAVVGAGCFFGASVNDTASYSLVGCTTAPGFEFNDLEIPRRDKLIARFPRQRRIIEKLTR